MVLRTHRADGSLRRTAIVALVAAGILLSTALDLVPFLLLTLALISLGLLLLLPQGESIRTAEGTAESARDVDSLRAEPGQSFQPVAPTTLEPHSVIRAFFENGKLLGNAMAAHLWFADSGSGTLRMIVSEGPLSPSDRPLPLDDPTLGRALSRGTVTIDQLNRFTTPTSGTTVVSRVSFPVVTGDLKGVAGLDFVGPVPDGEGLTALGTAMRLPLAAALALHRAQKRTEESVALIDAARELSGVLDAHDVLRLTLDRAIGLAQAGTGSIMLLDEVTSQLTIAEASGLPEDVIASTVVKIGEGIAGWVAASGQAVLIEDLPGNRVSGQKHGVRSAVSVPLGDDQGLLGVINVGSRTFPARFTREHLEALELLGQQAAVALRNARRVSSAGELYFDTLRTLAIALEAKDPYSEGGTERVVEYATAIARAMHLDRDESRAIEIAAMLHDIGMSALGSVGAEGTRPLTTVDRGLLKMHPMIAADILEQAPALRSVAPIVYHHHEHFDGTGYVAGVAGEGIPLGARILSVADAYVAMTSDRPYRNAMSTERAAGELLEKAGTQFDPDVVSAFLGLLGSGANRVPERDA